MKRKIKPAAAGLLSIVLTAVTHAQTRQPVDYVNPLIGTTKSSHITVWESRGATFPGVLLPFGMVQITPDNYDYGHTEIKSFSFLNHHSGWTSRGSFNLMATIGTMPVQTFDHREEKATPYFYQVKLKESGINAEFTAAQHTALCRFTFPESDSACFHLPDASEVRAYDGNEIRGRSAGYYFVAQFNKTFSSSAADSRSDDEQKTGQKQGAPYSLRFSTESGEKLLIRIGFSLSSYAAAESNLHAEMPGWNFEQAVERAKETWNNQLAQIEIETKNETQKIIFYTALYHSLLMPAVLSDADLPGKIYSPLYPWDTYRSEHPLITILDPEREGDMISSELANYDKTGWLPTGNMMGNHNIQILLDGFVKGIKNFDRSKAAEAICKSLLDSPYARREMLTFVQYGYVPSDITSSVTHTLEFAYDHWAAAQFLEKTGYKESHKKAYQLLNSRAANYINIYDPVSGFMRAKTTDGQWTGGGYCEGTDWTYTWNSPHDVQGLINLMGGRIDFSNRLNACFEQGHYVHDNEPPLHYAYLFNFSGEAWRTQYWARKITEDSYSEDPGGIPGNDDLGALSSWYVFSAMGFYPATPGTAQYEIGSPLFKRTRIHLHNGKQFTIIADQVSKKNKFIQSATLDGQAFNKSWFTHEDILDGKTLRLKMGPEPNKNWGNPAGSAPYSMTRGSPRFLPEKISISKKRLRANESAMLSFRVKNQTPVAGTARFQIIADGKPYKTITEVFTGGETRRVQTTISLYSQGKHQLAVTGLPPVDLVVEKTAPAFQYRDLETPMPPLVRRYIPIRLLAKVKNTGSYSGTTNVPLWINGEKIQTKCIRLAAGEEKIVRFNYMPKSETTMEIGIGNLKTALIRVLDSGERRLPGNSLYAALNARLILNFDEGESGQISDHSGQDNKAVVVGKLNWVPGIYGLAIQTNALLGNYIAFPEGISMNKSRADSALTMMAWIYPMEEENFSDIISKGDWNALQLKGSNQIVNFYAAGWEGHEAMATVPENWNRHWHHVAGVFNGTEYKLYIDGRLSETKRGEKRNPHGETGTSDYSGMPWNIGRNAGSPDRVFNGYIDDVMIFDKALNPQELLNLMLHIY